MKTSQTRQNHFTKLLKSGLSKGRIYDPQYVRSRGDINWANAMKSGLFNDAHIEDLEREYQASRARHKLKHSE